MASRRSIAPGAALLRSSRVFSVPPPLPKPEENWNPTGNFSSDTATAIHPTHLSITTPQTSRVRGDWGLKRSLPLRSTTKSSTPVIRVSAMDTYEHITEYASAADHSLTLQKWQELGVALSTPIQKMAGGNYFKNHLVGKSVFEDQLDTIFRPQTDGPRDEEVRWRFKGPWLAGQSEGQFNEYMRSTVLRQKNQFREFIRNQCATEERRKLMLSRREAENASPPKGKVSQGATSHAHESTTAPEGAPVESKQIPLPKISDDQLYQYMKGLRQDRAELYKQIRTFLDLSPTSSKKSMPRNIGAFIAGDVDEPEMEHSSSPYAFSGPPKTHPSAGLSYSRTSSKLENHPIYGPQQVSKPIEARIVTPRNAPSHQLSLGVGGFIAMAPDEQQMTNAPFGRNIQSTAGLQHNFVDPDKIGGSKMWIQTKSASIMSTGKVSLQVEKADPVNVAVATNKVDELPVAPMKTLRPTYGRFGSTRRIPLSNDPGVAPPTPTNAQTYGL
ncbi:mitochondrial ribosomal protein MRP51 [Amylocarpus encephaloides]|uniref:Mitochondrial ribosomal protein MRP51 n=1 Tax=Amylocarpus encephaloides TaxID=45428 RepID=A0A9P7YSW7_9HELO|nr:mitochondrial ribosomal protein MRP51 [Amylocarpus encephaloides]